MPADSRALIVALPTTLRMCAGVLPTLIVLHFAIRDGVHSSPPALSSAPPYRSFRIRVMNGSRWFEGMTAWKLPTPARPVAARAVATRAMDELHADGTPARAWGVGPVSP